MTISQIKKDLSITSVLNHYGHLANKNNMMCCPFHSDKTPSLQIYPKTNSYCCFSTACSAGTGDQLKYIELMEAQLGKVAGDQKTIKRHALVLAKELCGWRAESLLDVFTKLRSSLLRSKKAQEYAKGRGLDIENLEVGYNGGSYRDLKNCLVFPLKDEQGRIVSLYGRSIVKESRSRHFYQRGRSGFYPSCPSLDTEYLILTEGVIDAASLIQEGELEKGYSVLALYGAKVLGADQERALRSLSKLKEVIFYFDGDEAGRLGGQKWKAYLGKLLNQ